MYKSPDTGPREAIELYNKRHLISHNFVDEYVVRFGPKRGDAIIKVVVVKQVFYPLLYDRIPLLNQHSPGELMPAIINIGGNWFSIT